MVIGLDEGKARRCLQVDHASPLPISMRCDEPESLLPLPPSVLAVSTMMLLLQFAILKRLLCR